MKALFSLWEASARLFGAKVSCEGDSNIWEHGVA